jgi:hypothetical protein
MLLPIIGFGFLLNFIQTPQPKFQHQTIDSAISIGYGLALGDIDGDRKPDILLADKKQFVWYRNGDWKKFVMAENLTSHDNVCIAARDIDGDGKVEVAVGAQWNPSETGNAEQSGAVFYLIRPEDPTQMWKAVKLYHEPTIHRMRWYTSSGGKYYLVVLPLHGIDNKGGEGEGANILMYQYPANVNAEWPTYKLKSNMHLTHNFEIMESKDEKNNGVYIAGKEGVEFIHEKFFTSPEIETDKLPGMDKAAGELRFGKLSSRKNFAATIEPMHGENVVVYKSDDANRVVVDGNLKEGHALACADFLGVGSDQVIAGWRVPNKDNKVGIKLYVEKNSGEGEWESHWIDKNGMACEDIKVMDMDGDGKQDIVASGRTTHNVKIYWNKSAR